MTTAPTESSNDPFFIVGVHRSGTTLLRLMLNNHPHLAVPFETVFIIEFYRKLEQYGDLSRRESHIVLQKKNPALAKRQASAGHSQQTTFIHEEVGVAFVTADGSIQL